MSNKLDAELARVREKLLEAVEANRYTVRGLERQMGVPLGTRRKVLNGDVTLSFRHVLEILDALGMPFHQFFGAVFPAPGEQGPSLKLGAAPGASPSAVPPELPELVRREVQAAMAEMAAKLLSAAERRDDDRKDPLED